MPTKRPRKKAQPKLGKEEIEEMEALGFDDEEMELMEQRLNKTEWDFASKAKYFRLELSWQPDLLLSSGKRTKNNTNLTARFLDHYLPTKDRRTAFLIYCSDAFRDLRVWDINEANAVRQEEKYQEFKQIVEKDPEQLDRLKQDLAAEEQIPA